MLDSILIHASNHSDDLAEARDALVATTAQLESTAAQVAALEATARSSEQRLAERQAEAGALQEAHDGLQAQVAEFSAELETAAAAHAVVQQQLADAQAQLQAAQQRAEGDGTARAAAETRTAALEAELADVRQQTDELQAQKNEVCPFSKLDFV